MKLFTEKTLLNPTLERGLVMTPEDSYHTSTFFKTGSDQTKAHNYYQFIRSGPRELIHYDPKTPDACAAIVTAGGLCPGLNTVIREIVRMLHEYGVEKVWGIRGGYKGAVKDDEWTELSDDQVKDIHMQGGTILVSDRGNPPHIEIAKTLQRRNVRWYFVLGGDGTHQGARDTYNEMAGIGYECAVCGVPKTIDNDIQFLDASFGFNTAVTEAEKAINSAYCEATTNANCIGLEKLMGRHCGWVAAMGSSAARSVDLCLIPEMEIDLDRVLSYVAEVMKRKKYCVIVVAEGCGDTLIKGDGATDAGGNKVMADVGPWLRDAILAHTKKESIPCTIKYIDPTYMIRSVQANAFDNMYCSVLAQEAVHGAMAGYTCFTVGKIDNVYCMIPIHAICGKGQRKMKTNSPVYDRMIMTTQQPSLAPYLSDSQAWQHISAT
jgi:6-phosphofructokinase 1